jgi:hypothetical protein
MAYTINTGTMLIEEGALMPESLRSANEPWTPFYMDGEEPNGGTGLLGAPECGDVMKLQMKINSETQVIQEAEFKTFGCGSPIASSSLSTEWVKGKTSRKRLPSRTRISSAGSVFPRATLLDAIRYSRIGGRLHLVGSPIFYWIIQ